MIDHNPFNDHNILFLSPMPQLHTLRISKNFINLAISLSEDGILLFITLFPNLKNILLNSTEVFGDTLVMLITKNMKNL